MSFFGFSEVWPDLILALCNELAVFFGTTHIFKHFHSIQKMFNAVIGTHNHTAPVPFADGPDKSFLFVGLDQII